MRIGAIKINVGNLVINTLYITFYRNLLGNLCARHIDNIEENLHDPDCGNH